jgi:hypothetical protein
MGLLHCKSVAVTRFEVLDQHLEEFSQHFEVLFQHFEVLLQHFEVLLQHFKYCPNILGAVPVLEVPSQHFVHCARNWGTVSELNGETEKTSKFSVWIDSLWAKIWTLDLPVASRESYTLKHYVRYEMYYRSIKVLSINCKGASVVVTYTVGWTWCTWLLWQLQGEDSGMFVLGTLQSDTKTVGSKCYFILIHYSSDSVGELRRKRQTIITANTLGGTWTWNLSEKQTRC